MATPDGFAVHTFPQDGLVALSREVYDSTPLLMAEIRPGVVVLAGAGGNITAIRGSRESAIIDTGYVSRVAEIENEVTGGYGRPPRWVINTHWHFDHTDGNSAFLGAVDGTDRSAMKGVPS
jgi:glyoxylase-like metal-dependent hydrolase (beta-lactamase superfamily II)